MRAAPCDGGERAAQAERERIGGERAGEPGVDEVGAIAEGEPALVGAGERRADADRRDAARGDGAAGHGQRGRDRAGGAGGAAAVPAAAAQGGERVLDGAHVSGAAGRLPRPAGRRCGIAGDADRRAAARPRERGHRIGAEAGDERPIRRRRLAAAGDEGREGEERGERPRDEDPA